MRSDFPSVTYPWLAAQERSGLGSDGSRTPRAKTSLGPCSTRSLSAHRPSASALFSSRPAPGSMSRPWWRVRAGARVVGGRHPDGRCRPRQHARMGSRRSRLQRLQVALRPRRRRAACGQRGPRGPGSPAGRVERQRDALRLHSRRCSSSPATRVGSSCPRCRTARPSGLLGSIELLPGIGPDHRSVSTPRGSRSASWERRRLAGTPYRPLGDCPRAGTSSR